MSHCPAMQIPEQLLRCGFPLTTPGRAAFRDHLVRIARALAEIGRSDAMGCVSAAEREAIQLCIGDAILQARATGPVADACRSVLEGYDAAWSPLDAPMLQRLVHLGDLIPAILADEARLTLAFGVLRQVLFAFDHAEHRDAERHPQIAAALQAIYRTLGLAWPGRP